MQELEKFIDYSIELLEDEKLDKGLNEERESLLEQLKDLQVKLNLPKVNRSKPSKDEQVLSDEETDLLLTAHYQTVVDIDKALDYEQSIEDE